MPFLVLQCHPEQKLGNNIIKTVQQRSSAAVLLLVTYFVLLKKKMLTDCFLINMMKPLLCTQPCQNGVLLCVPSRKHDEAT